VLTVAAVNGRAAGFEVKSIRPLFAMPANLSGRGFDRDSLVTGYPYDVAPDGQRFLAITPLEQPVEPVIVMTNWMASLRK
jgi:hypothetical protein